MWVSNHGARQLDAVEATLDALPDVVDAARGTGMEVYVDGGVRRGSDAFKALALGANAVFVGRPVIWGLAKAVRDTLQCARVPHLLSSLSRSALRPDQQPNCYSVL